MGPKNRIVHRWVHILD